MCVLVSVCSFVQQPQATANKQLPIELLLCDHHKLTATSGRRAEGRAWRVPSEGESTAAATFVSWCKLCKCVCVRGGLLAGMDSEQAA